jgi:hypothetical protein
MKSRRNKLGAFALIAVLLGFTIPAATGCSEATIAQNIVNWTPALESTAATAAATFSVLQPQDAALVGAGLLAFNTGANLVDAQAKAYLANPSATVLQQLQTAVVTFQQQVNATLLSAAKITNPQSQQTVTAAVNAVSTVINSIFALIAGIKGNTITAMVTNKTVTLAMTKAYRDDELAVEMIAMHYGESVDDARAQVVQGEQTLAAAGF